MEHFYNVVWADDDVQVLLKDYKLLFEKQGVNIIPFATANSAIDYIRVHHNMVDGIIVDAKFSRGGEAVQEESNAFPGLSLFIQEISSLRREAGMPYPCWIFTGYGDRLRDRYDTDDLSGFEGIVRKGANNDVMREWVSSICEKIALTQSRAFKLRQENAKLFELCTDSYLGEATAETLFSILDYDRDDKSVILRSIRDVLTEMLDLLVKEDIICSPTDKTAISDRIRNLKTAYKNKLPQYVIPSLDLLAVTNSLSHPGNENMDVNNGVIPFMYESLLNTLKNMLYWLKHFIDKERAARTSNNHNSSIDISSTERDTIIQQDDNSIEGRLCVHTWKVQLVDSRQYCFLNRNIKIENSWKPGRTVRVITGKDNDGRTIVKKIVSMGRG